MLTKRYNPAEEGPRSKVVAAATPKSLDAYRAFIAAKPKLSTDCGFQVSPHEVHPLLKPHQNDIVRWAVHGGRRAIFARFGLGKTLIQLETLRLILEKVATLLPIPKGLIVLPLGVRQEFKRDAEKVGIPVRFIRSIAETESLQPPASGLQPIFLTNYETVRDGKLDPRRFTVTSLDEAAVLRGFGGTKTFREFMRLFEEVRYRFVATATPDPNEYIELLAYAAYLGIMDVSQAKTRFFKRDSTHADRLTIHPHREREFWLWVSSWALFLQRPSDLGHSDEGYDLPPLEVLYHEVPVDHSTGAGSERDGQQKMFREATHGVVDAAREKRDTLPQRVSRMKEILAAEPAEHWLLWHDLEAERHAIAAAVPDATPIYGLQDLDEREQAVIDFSDGKLSILAAKPVIAGSGCNFQRHCARAVFCGIGFKFNDFIQAMHRIYRFLQTRPVKIHLIYAESERRVLQNLKAKWRRYEERAERMSKIIRDYGLSQRAMLETLTRSLAVDRIEVTSAIPSPTEPSYRLVNNDCVEETHRMADASVHLILTSIPFSTQYEYTPSYLDFGYTEDNPQFFQQMDFLTPELLRILQPGRICAIHVKDRVVPGGMTGLGFQTVYPFHADCIRHFTRHGFAFLGMKTIVTDVVRENNQTYRLGWTEQCKDGTKMGYGMPEYLLLFRRPPTDHSNSYADVPVVKLKRKYSRSRWQIDAHGFARSNGNRPLSPEEITALPHAAIFKLFRKYTLEQVYDFEYHIRLGEVLEEKGILPVTFMLLQPASWHPDVWTDITRMRTLNALQCRKGKQMHLCPLQFDICDRVIAQYSMEGELVYDPFAGLMTVPLCAVQLGRRAYGVELNPGYFLDGCAYVEAAVRKMAMPTLFDLTGVGPAAKDLATDYEDGGGPGPCSAGVPPAGPGPSAEITRCDRVPARCTE
jgi:hypothetical protein